MKAFAIILIASVVFTINVESQNLDPIQCLVKKAELIHSGEANQSSPLQGNLHNDYFEESNPDSIHLWKWNVDLQQWFFEQRTINTKDSEGNIIQRLFLKPFEGVWNEDERITYEYNVHNNLIKYVRQILNDSLWINIHWDSFVYDSANNLIESIYHVHNGSEWILSGRSIHSYGSDNQLLSSSHEDWVQNEWITNERIDYTYDMFGRLEISWYFNLDHTGVLVNYGRDVCQYDDEDRLVQLSGQLPSGGGLWNDISRQLWSYETQRISYVLQNKNFDEWVNTSNRNYRFDENQNLESSRLQYWQDQWVNNDSLQLFNLNLTSITENKPDKSFVISPNPATNNLQIDFKNELQGNKEIKIFSMLGVEVAQPFFSDISLESIDISYLAPGQYFIMVISDQGIESSCFLKI